jgi:hypothetical protein
LENSNLEEPLNSLKLKQKIEWTRAEKLEKITPEQRLFENYSVLWWFKEENEISDYNSINVNWVQIDWLTRDEYLKISTWEDNEEALKNLVDMRQKLSYLWLDFVWEQRNIFINILKNNSEFSWSNFNSNDKDLINRTDFNILLKFILKIYWENNPTDLESENNAKIIKINQIWTLNNKKDTITWFSNIWMKFVEIWFFNSSWWVNLNWEYNLRQFVENNLSNKK